MPVIRTPAKPKSRASTAPLPFVDGFRERTLEATRPASNPPSRAIGKMAKIAKYDIVETLGVALELAI